MAELHANLGHGYKNIGSFEQALEAYRSALRINANFGDAQYGIGNLLWQLGDERASLDWFHKRVEIGGNEFSTWASATDASILSYLHSDRTSAINYLRTAAPIENMRSESARPVQAYYRFMKALIAHGDATRLHAKMATNCAPLYVVGDSHCLSLNGLPIKYRNIEFAATSKLIKGVKQFHISNERMNQFRRQFEIAWSQLPLEATVLLTIGEIDCRPDEGIFTAWQKAGENKSLDEVAADTVGRYCDYIWQLAGSRQRDVLFCGVPACNKTLPNLSNEMKSQFLGMLKVVNAKLREFADEHGIGFLDVYSVTDSGSGQSNGQWHIDNVHLVPEAYSKAFSLL